eukprot:6202592-Pleurochrysis_carterae.AAC.4
MEKRSISYTRFSPAFCAAQNCCALRFDQLLSSRALRAHAHNTYMKPNFVSAFWHRAGAARQSARCNPLACLHLQTTRSKTGHFLRKMQTSQKNAHVTLSPFSVRVCACAQQPIPWLILTASLRRHNMIIRKGQVGRLIGAGGVTFKVCTFCKSFVSWVDVRPHAYLLVEAQERLFTVQFTLSSRKMCTFRTSVAAVS